MVLDHPVRRQYIAADLRAERDLLLLHPQLIELGLLLGGTVVTETVFAWPGIGMLTMQALQNIDFPIVQAAVFLLALVFVFINLAVDLIYAWLDPRIRYG